MVIEDAREPSWLARAVAAELRARRAIHRISQTRIAAALGRSQGYVSGRLAGHAAFDLDDVDGIARLIGEDPFDFLISVVDRAADLEDLGGGAARSRSLRAVSPEDDETTPAPPMAARRGNPRREVETDD